MGEAVCQEVLSDKEGIKCVNVKVGNIHKET